MASSKSRSLFRNPSGKVAVTIDWETENVNAVVGNEMRQRVRHATTLLKDVVILNISRPVGKTITEKGKIRKERSKPGEFPRRDFGILVGTMMSGMTLVKPGNWEGFVGTPLDYGVSLELKLDPETKKTRSYLVRTLWEEAATITKILSAPMKV